MHSVVTELGPTSPVFDLTTVDAVNSELNLTSDTANDAEVAAQITAASQIIATECDQDFSLRDISESFRIRYHEHVKALPLSRFPVSTITSVTVNDVLLDGINYELDKKSGLLWRINGHWHGHIIAIYQSGFDLPDEAPASLARACIELIRSQRATAGSSYNPNIRDIWAGENRISYFGPQAIAEGSALPQSIALLIEPFKRLGT